MTTTKGMARLVPRALRAAGLRASLQGSVLVLFASVLMLGCAPPDAPVVVMDAGKILAVRNCPPSNTKYEFECLRLACQKILYERGTIPVGAPIVATQGSHNISDMPGKSWHQVKFQQADGFGYAECEMNDKDVISAQGLRSRDQKW